MPAIANLLCAGSVILLEAVCCCGFNLSASQKSGKQEKSSFKSCSEKKCFKLFV